MVLEYMIYATNNKEMVMNDMIGATCIYCFKNPIIDNDTETCDISTIICPLCGIDAVVPTSVIPNRETLLEWHNKGFGI